MKKHKPILGKYTYNQYISSKEWRERRQSMSTDAVCFTCGTKDNLHLHHITYERIGNEKPEDLVWLCRKHHKSIHKFARRKRIPLHRAHLEFRMKKKKLKKNKLSKEQKIKLFQSQSSDILKHLNTKDMIKENRKNERKRIKELKEQRLKLFENTQ